MSYAIITDTSSNLPLSRLAGEDISLVPFSYYEKINPDEVLQCFDIENFDGKAYYDKIRQGKLYNTSQVAPQTYYDYIAPYAERGEDILYIGMSSGISGAYNSSLIAKDMLKESFPDRKFFMLDTRAASLGEGIVVLKAIELRQNGVPIEEAFETLSKLCDNVYQIFTVDSLKHLQRTGRLSGAAALIGTVLNIKPILRGNEFGQIINCNKVRGNNAALKLMAERYNELVKDAGSQVVGIAHSDNMEGVNFLISLLNEKNPPKEILTVMYEPVTGTHVGPGTIALFFLGDSDVRFK